MDALTYYNQLVEHFQHERELLTEYNEMVTPNHAEIHQLQWNERDKVEEKASLEAELSNLDEQIIALRNDYKIKQTEITNAKISQSMRQSQIARLSGLSQPIELDQTYFFVDRYGKRQSQQTSDATTIEHKAPANGGIGRIGHMRTGEAVLLESRLLDISNLVDGHLNALTSKLAAVNTSDNNMILLRGDVNSSRVQLKTEANTLVHNLDKVEHSLFATILEILNLRLRMIVAQRQEVEMRDALNKDRKAFQLEEAEVMADMEKQLLKTTEQFERDLASRTMRYEKQLRLFTKKLENLESMNPEVEVAKKERILREKLLIARNRYDQLKRRHSLEVEGYANEAKALRQKLQHVLTLLKQQTNRTCCR